MEKKIDRDENLGKRNYPGVQTDTADGGKVDEELVREDVRDLNNNPRNNEGPCPGK